MKKKEKSKKGIGYVTLYIDDNLTMGGIGTINNAMTVLKENGLVLSTVQRLQNCLSSKMKFSKDKRRAWLRQLHLIKNLVKKFRDHVKKFEAMKFQVCPNFIIVMPFIENEKISTENQREFRQG